MTTAKLQLPSEVHVIGAGGTGSWVLPCLVRLVDATKTIVHVWDGDVLEAKNLDRQLFSSKDIGRNKAIAMTGLMEGKVWPRAEYFHNGSEVAPGSLVISCADNHVARRSVIEVADREQGSAIIAGNEYIDAEAYYYSHEWRGSLLDPRVFAPTIATSDANDPRSPESCTGVAQLATPQLVIANMTSADYVMRLLWFWFAVVPSEQWEDDARANFTTAIYATTWKTWVVTVQQAMKGQRQ